jgi:autotransporter translocation and assembly factor TamB
MTTTILRSAAAAIVFAGALALATPSVAGMVNFKASLSGKSEVPPNTVAATGSVTATYDTDSKKLTWKGTYSGLTGPATAAHFHGPAQEGKNAGVLVPISPNGPSFEGSATLTDAQAKALMDGDVYVNVHTADNKGGEIRGQLTK